MTGGVDILIPNGLLGGLLAAPTDTEMRSEESSILDSTQEAHDTSDLRDKGEQRTPTSAQDDTEMDSESLVPNGLLLLDASLGGATVKDLDVPLSSAFAADASEFTDAGKEMDTDEGFGEPVLFNLTRQQDELQLDSSPVTQPIPLSQSQSDYQDEEFPEISDLLKPYTSASASTSTPSPVASSSTPRISLRATNFDGRTVLLKRKPKQYTSILNTSRMNRDKMGNLLDTPIHRLMEELSLNTATKLAQEDARAQGQATSSVRSTNDKATLWVDRYRPRRFVDLVGDDRVHREVMSWVKEWDFCVFGKSKGKKRARDEENPDEYRRPNEKLLLISGPPGLGKTTLAHVIAKQAGYVVFEVNASDARSAQVVDDVIRPALESGKHIKKNKPYLIVIDEIDGATGGSDTSAGFIHRLIQLTLDKPTKKKGRKGETEGPRPLLRPIICICNDLYHSSLTKLRQHARIIRVNRSNDQYLVNRLRDICEMEELRADSSALSTLVGVAQGDLRGCLNTLQLIKARNETVTDTVIRRVSSGMKVGDVSQASVLNDLFLPMSRRRAKELGVGEEEEARYVSRLSLEIDRSGALDKIAVGCFEHYSNLRKHDGNFERYLKANEWLSTFDLMSGEMRLEREYALREYLPYTLVPFYPLFQERSAPKVERPKADWENFTKTKVNEEIYKSLATCLRTAGTRHGSEGAYRHFASAVILHTEFAPLINRIIAPPLRPVNSQVIRPEERSVLTRLVDIMVSLELRFMQEKSEDGQLMYRLEPPVDVFVTYDGKRASDIAVSRYAVRHLVASEIDARLANRQAGAMAMAAEKPKANTRNFFGGSGKRPATEIAGGEDRTLGDGTLLAGESEKELFKRVRRDEKIEEKVPTDFFGRPIVPKKGNNKPASSRKVQTKRPPVVYKFNEGNSAAVRKPVKVNAFL